MHSDYLVPVIPPLSGGLNLYKLIEPGLSRYCRLAPIRLNQFLDTVNLGRISDFSRIAIKEIANSTDGKPFHTIISACAGCTIALDTARIYKETTGRNIRLILIDPPFQLHPYFGTSSFTDFIRFWVWNRKCIYKMYRRKKWLLKMPAAIRYGIQLRKAGGQYICRKNDSELHLIISKERHDTLINSFFYRHHKDHIKMYIVGEDHNTIFHSEYDLLEKQLIEIINSTA